MNIRILTSVLLILVLIPAVGAFDLRQVYITIDHSGDAVITASYDENPAEYVGIKAADATFLSSKLRSLTNRDVSVLCTDYGVTELKVAGFAEVRGREYTTPVVDLVGNAPEGIATRIDSIDLRGDVTIVFPDGYSVSEPGTTILHSHSHTVGSQKVPARPGPEQQCTKKTVPVSGIIPEPLIPVAAAGAGIAVTGLGLTSLGSLLSSWLGHLVSYLQNMFGSLVARRIYEKDREKREVLEIVVPKRYFGFTGNEFIVLVAGAVIIGTVFFYAERKAFDPLVIGIYILVGGFTLTVHEIAHWYVTRRYKSHAEIQFWGLGTLIMMITAWLFGNVFAYPTLTVVHSEVPLAKREIGLIMLSGPVLSFIIALCCLLIVPFGGLYRTAGILGFSANLLTCVFELLPITPCEGREVFQWNKIVWAIVFVPLMLVYFVANI